MKNFEKKSPNGVVRGSLPQTSTRAYQKICEEFSLENVILEIAQNAFEHGDARCCSCKFWYDEEGHPHITFFNNGRPMTDKQFQKFTAEYHAHDITNSVPSSNGVFTALKGYGLKDSVVFCSTEHGVSLVTFTNYHEDGHFTRWWWKICKENGEAGSYREAIESGNYDTMQHQSGFEIHISNSKEFTETEFKKAQKIIAKTFTTEAISRHKTIQMTWKNKGLSTIKLYDPMHFEQMPLPEGKTIYNCEVGEYISDDIIWFVKEDRFKGLNNNGEYVEIPIRVIYEYINGPTYKKKYPRSTYYDNIAVTESGLFPLLGQVYLETGGNLSTHFDLAANGGGAARFRVCTIITNENGFLWGINSTKNNGITPCSGNPYLCMNFKKIEEDGTVGEETLFDYLRRSFTFLRKFHEEKIKPGKDVYDTYGFTDKEKVRADIESFKRGENIDSRPVETFCPVIVPSTNDVMYTLNKKGCIIKKIQTEDGVRHTFNSDVVGSDFNEATKEDILFSVFDTLQEIGVDPSVYLRLAELLPITIHHYEE